MMHGDYRLIQEEPHTLIVQVVGKLTPDMARVMLDHVQSYAAQIEGGMATLIDLSRAAPVSSAAQACLLALMRVDAPGVEAIFGVSPLQRLLLSASLKASRLADRCRCFDDEQSARLWVTQRNRV